MWLPIAASVRACSSSRLRARVSARRLAPMSLDQLVRDERRAEAQHLLARRRPHVERRDDAAEPARGGDGLESRDAGADDEHLGRRDVARGGREHRQKLAERRRRR